MPDRLQMDKSKQAVLLMNLGSPDSPRVADVRRYLKEFLSDGRVLDTHPFVRALILQLLILPFRPRKAAEAYRAIWTDKGSPLIVVSHRQRELLAEATGLRVALAMRYGRPSMEKVVRELADSGIQSLFLVPLYPHYAMASYETVVVRAMELLRAYAPQIETTLLQPFFDNPDYIDTLVARSRPFLEREYDLILFSFHGIPERHLRKTDPSHHHCLAAPHCCQTEHPAHATCYRHQCLRTVDEFVERAGIPSGKWAVSFQSRLGRDPWLRPYTDHELVRLGLEGIKKILVLCPAFVSDCLETLEEIGIRGAASFQASGGDSLTLIPCLNDHPAWIEFLRNKATAWAWDAGTL